MKYKIRIDKAWLIQAAIILLIVGQVYSYLFASWEITTFERSKNIIAVKLATNNLLTIGCKYIALAFVLIASFQRAVNKRGGVWIAFGLTALVFLHSVISAMDSGIQTLLYTTYSPPLYLLVLVFYLGSDDAVWRMIQRISKVLLLVYMLLFVFEFLTFFMRYGWAISSNSSLMTYYSQSFWAAVLFLYVTFEKKKQTAFTYVILAVLCLGSVLINSRGWIIQAALLTVITVWLMMSNSNRSISSRIFAIVMIVAVISVAMFLMNNLFSSFIDSLLRKGTNDTRSSQYYDILAYTSPEKWFFGAGMSATYETSDNELRSSIDNQTLFIAFHYGIFTMLLYFWNFYKTFFSCVKHRKRMRLFAYSAWIVFLWLASLNGLSVFNGVSLDVKCILMPLLAGRIYYKKT